MGSRPAGAGDGQLLWSVYRSSRLDEVSAWGWGDAQIDAFLQMQWQTEQRARAMQHPHADSRVIVVDGKDVGRLLVDRAGDCILVVDIALLSEARGRGIGRAVLGDLLIEAQGRGVPVVLCVRRGNRAERLYRSLGFLITSEDELHLHMAFKPLVGAAAGVLSRSEAWQTRS